MTLPIETYEKERPMRQRPFTIFTGLLLGLSVTATAQPISLTLSRTSVQGGESSNGQIGLGAPAPSGGFAIKLASTNPMVASVPSSASVSGGVASVGFIVTTFPVAQATNVTITAAAGKELQSVALTVLPPELVDFSLERSSVLGSRSVSGIFS